MEPQNLKLKLRVFNIFTVLFHLAGLIIALVYIVLKKDRVTPLFRGYVTYPRDGGEIVFGAVQTSSISLLGLIAAFFGLSFTMQLIPVAIPSLWNDTFKRLKTQGIQPYRWIEYSFSASCLFLAGALINGLTDFYFTLVIFASSWAVMMLGLVQELVAFYLRDIVRMDKKLYELNLLGEKRPRQLTKVEFFLPHVIGWIPYFFLWYVALDTFRLNGAHADPDVPAGKGWGLLTFCIRYLLTLCPCR